jgi:virulence-associated protein VagC
VALVRSNPLTQEVKTVGQKLAKEDIVEVNEAGQHVVVVPAGQPIPDDLQERKQAAKESAPSQEEPEDAASADEPKARSKRSSSKK